MRVPGAVQNVADLDAGQIRFDTAAGEINAYAVSMRGELPAAGIVVVHEAFGLVEHVKDVARRFAALGYAALAPNLYSNVPAFDSTDRDAARQAMFALHDHDAVTYLEGAAATLRQRSGSELPVGCIGFCSGGRQALLAACRAQGFDAAVDCWGGWIDRGSPDAETTDTRPERVLDMVGGLRIPLYAAFGAEDTNPSPADAAALQASAAAAGALAVVRVFDGAGHAFFADYRDTYRPEPAFVLWEDVTAFFEAHLGGR